MFNIKFLGINILFLKIVKPFQSMIMQLVYSSEHSVRHAYQDEYIARQISKNIDIDS